MEVFKEKELCGYEINDHDIETMKNSILLKSQREKRYGSDADRFSNVVSEILKVSKSEIMAAMEEEDKSLKRKRKKT